MIQKKQVARGIRWFVLLVGLLLTTGCPAFNFLATNHYFARSTFGGDLYMLVVYDGIYAEILPPPPPDAPQKPGLFQRQRHSSESKEGQIAQGLQELNDAVSNEGRAFIAGSNTFGISHSVIEDILQEMEKDGGEKKKNEPEGYALAQHLAKNYEVRFGGFFRDANTQRLCAYQVVRLERVRKFMPLVNSFFYANCIKGSEKQENLPQTELLFRNPKHKWFTLKGSALQFHLPVAPEEAAQARSEFWKTALSDQLKNIEQETSSTLETYAKIWAQTPVSMVQSADEISFHVGDPKQKINQIVLSAGLTTETLGRYSDNLLAPISQQPNWKGDLNPETVVNEFEKSPAALFNRLPVCVPIPKTDAKEKGKEPEKK